MKVVLQKHTRFCFFKIYNDDYTVVKGPTSWATKVADIVDLVCLLTELSI